MVGLGCSVASYHLAPLHCCTAWACQTKQVDKHEVKQGDRFYQVVRTAAVFFQVLNVAENRGDMIRAVSTVAATQSWKVPCRPAQFPNRN